MHTSEMLAVGTVVGILGLVSGFLILDARSQLRDVVRIAHVRDVQIGLDVFFMERGAYPEVTEPLALGQVNSACLGVDGFSGPCASGSDPFIALVPAPPAQGLNEQSSCGNIENAYCYQGNVNAFRMSFELEAAHARLGLAKGLNCLTENGFSAGACPAL